MDCAAQGNGGNHAHTELDGMASGSVEGGRKTGDE
jgi:hypothetical protein